MTARERDRTLEDGTDLEDLAAMLDEQSVLLQRLVEMAENRPADASGKDGTESGDGPTLATLDASVLEVLKNLKAQSKTLNRLSRTAGADAGGKDDAKSGEKPTLATIDAGLLLALDALDAQSKMLDDLMQSPAAGGEAATADRETAAAVRTAAADIARAASAERSWRRVLVWAVLARPAPGALALGLLAQASLGILPPGAP